MQLELLKQSELLKAREEYEAEIKTAREQLEEELSRAHEQMGYEVDRQQAIATELARERDAALDDLRARLENERTANAELRWSLERSEAKLATLERDQADTRGAHDADRSKLDQLQSELEQERTSNTELQSELTRVQGASIDLQAQHARLQSDNVDLQAANTELQNTIAGLQSTNTGLQGTNVELQSTNSELQAARAGFAGGESRPPERGGARRTSTHRARRVVQALRHPDD